MSDTSHGTAKPYITGFILSLIFTVIPYYIVVNETLWGTVLLGAILAIAVLQMVIQVVFFLHLGRERKPYWQRYFFLGTIVGILTVVGGSIFIMSHLHRNMSPADTSLKLSEDEGIAQVGGEKTGACKGRHEHHRVTISNGVVSPRITVAHLCDSLIFVNQDDAVREIAFGTHPRHTAYGGESEVTVRHGRNKSVVLNQPGSYQFHDHLDPAVNGYFTVEQ